GRGRRAVYAGSTSAYGNSTRLPNSEEHIAHPLGPYAAAKLAGEGYCIAFHATYGLETVSLRYFNVFGPRQDPKSEYAAVVPRFITRLLADRQPTIYGDGEQTRDFTFVANVVDANWKAATHPAAAGEVFNIGCGTRTSLNQLVGSLNQILKTSIEPIYVPPRTGDIRHSVADVSKAARLLGYHPAVDIHEALRKVLA